MRKYNLLLWIGAGVILLCAVLWVVGNREKPAYRIISASVEDEEEEEEIEACGVERWSIKVLNDADSGSINFKPKASTIYDLTTMRTTSVSSNTPRLSIEKQAYQVHCILTKLKLEDDGDYHLVLADSNGNTMIGEIPDPTCGSTTSSHHLSQFKACRSFIDKHYNVSGSFQNVNAKVVVTGVTYVDPPHGQTGAAPNNMELHSIIDVYYDTVTQVHTGIAEAQQVENIFRLYPNPVHEEARLEINSPNAYRHLTVSLYSADGKELKHIAVPEGAPFVEIDREGLKNGLYFYRIADNNKILVTERLLFY